MRLINKLIKLFVTLQVLILISCTVGDEDPPSDFLITLNENNRTVEFTAPGDDGNTGIITIYDLRYFDEFQLSEIMGSPVDDVPFSTIEQTVISMFDDAIQIQGEELPQQSGTPQSIFIPRLTPLDDTRYYFALIARDEVANESDPSNVVETTTEFKNVSYLNNNEASCFGESITSGKLDMEEERDDNEFRDGDDIVIGDPCQDTVYVFFGGKNFADADANSDTVYQLPSPDTADITITGPTGTMFGASVAVIDDVAGDDADELVIGAPGFSSNTGRVYIVFGDNDGLPSVINLNTGFSEFITITGESAGDNFGLTMLHAIGVTGNRSDSLIIAAPTALSSRGRVYFFEEGDLDDFEQGDQIPITDAQAVFSGENSGDMFGTEIAEVGIIDDDSRNDFAITSPAAARVYIFFGDSDLDDIDLSTGTSSVAVLTGDSANDFGASVGGGGDYDGDPEDDDNFGDISRSQNREDVLVGEPGFNGNRGRMLFYSGFDIEDAFELGISPTPSKEIAGLTSEGRFGAAIHDMGDINPDLDPEDASEGGYVLEFDDNNDDFVVSAPSDGDGKVFLFLGRVGLPNSLDTDDADLVFESPQSTSGFGSKLENLGDINEDELNEIGIVQDDGLIVIF